MSAAPGLHIEIRGGLGVITLDRQGALNALTRAMIQSMSDALAQWRDDPQVAAVLVRAVPGRAFCAGGDVREVVDTLHAEGVDAASRFFFDEYRLNWRVGSFPKPYIAIMDGVTMGGGVGISVHGSHRIVTENTLLAMPETGIGLFPDVGTTHVLPRLPHGTGVLMALAGTRLDAADCRWSGLATHAMVAAEIESVIDQLVALPTKDVAAGLESLLQPFAGDPDLGEKSRLAGFAPACAACLESQPSLEAAVTALHAEAGEKASEILRAFEGKSPLAMKLTFEALRRGLGDDLGSALRREYGMVRFCLEHGDFAEGVRALLIDKDKAPRWRHAGLDEIPPALVESAFAPASGSTLRLDWERN